MLDKKAFVFDTNFIIQTKALNEVIENLSDRFTVYVTEVSIIERIAQQCREIKTLFEEAEKEQARLNRIATVTLKTTYEEQEDKLTQAVWRRYKATFGDQIIPFPQSREMLLAVFTRANRKMAPFLTDDKASDKGFKDALIWESIISYFQEKGESEVLLITDDGGFTKNEANLCAEFSERTGKSLSIHPNSYYRELLKPELVEEPPTPPQKKPEFNLEKMRDEIENVITNLCYTTEYSDYGDEYDVETFKVTEQVDSEYIEEIFNRLEEVYHNHFFEKELAASLVFDLDGRFTDGSANISISSIEDAIEIYNKIKEKPSYLRQFYTAIAAGFNKHYQKKEVFCNPFEEDGSELPF
ncbi:MAG: DUF4935 domain-containing protein [Oscillospiraceae bacterium]|nr:DUF4935 domain-containing protein [Oscillospiraceae bacterium]MBQ6159591.1 DUF4935 domain-containing protein [Oscillospiraceae bacterium]